MPSRKSSSYAPSYASRGRGGYRPSEPPERRSLSVLLVVVAAMAALAAFGWLQSRNAALPGGVRVAVAAGTVTMESPDTGEGPTTLALGQDAPVRAGESLRVSADGRAVLALGRAGRVELGPGAHIALLELAQQSIAGGHRARLALHGGSALGRLDDASGAELIVETTTVTVVSEGGVVLCQALAADHVQVAVYEGSATLSMGEQSAEVGAGEGIDARLGQPFTPVAVIQPAPTEVAVPHETAVAAAATLTDREKTLFPKVLTPTRPGDPPPDAGTPLPGDGTTVWYTVAKGDTLYSIARQYGVSWETIWEANKEALPKPEMLQVGQQLRIPSP